MKAFKGVFRKKDGTRREMVFARIQDLPQKFVFDALNDFCGIKKLLPDMIDSVECAGSGIGMLRNITLQGGAPGGGHGIPMGCHGQHGPPWGECYKLG